jgi:enamine deaminase RidA (YjgF/YER057c/UK114 family)
MTMNAKKIIPIIILVFLPIVTAFSQDKAINKEKFNHNKTIEDEIGYAQALKVGNTIYVSGTVGWGRMDSAMHIAYQRIETSLKHYNAGFQHVVKENLYTTQLDSVIKYKSLRTDYYKSDFPAATWVEVKRLYSPGLVVEIEVIAVLPEK